MLMLNEDQELIRDSAERLIAASYDFESRQRRLAQGAAFSAEMWQQFAELGWLGMALDEADGGIGAGPTELAIIARAFGQGLVTEPYLASVVLGAELLRRGASEDLRLELLPQVAAGTLQLAVAFAERGARYELSWVETSARADSDGAFVLNGAKSVVLNGQSADHVIVSARTRGATADADGITLLCVPTATPGVRMVGYRLNDQHPAADITFDDVRVDSSRVIDEVDAGLDLLEAVVDQACVIACAEAIGAMEAVMRMTLEYLNTREQFGRALGRNQALQFRMVELQYALEESRSMVAGALDALNGDPISRRAIVSATKVRVGNAARQVGREGIQLHGAIGMTEEYAVGHYYKRLETLRMLFGDPDHHLARFGKWNALRNSSSLL
ncbi:MAG: acyl-CoA dehydrogenase family protein [Gammaproteobacteria bacterium]|nr:acyl-CoA dehydrogenase family protein [Gammaproteobacteria bacterium]